MKTYRTGDPAPYGLYWALNGFDYRFVDEPGVPLPGKESTTYIRFPALVALALLPLLGAAFYFAFPVMVIAFVAFVIAKAAARPVQSLLSRKAHLTNMQWDPLMAHMKRPSEKDEKKQTAKDREEKK